MEISCIRRCCRVLFKFKYKIFRRLKLVSEMEVELVELVKLVELTELVELTKLTELTRLA